MLVRAALATLEASDEAAHLAIEALDWRLGSPPAPRCGSPGRPPRPPCARCRRASAGRLGVAGPAVDRPPPRPRPARGQRRRRPPHRAERRAGARTTGPPPRSSRRRTTTATPVTTRRPDLGVPAGGGSPRPSTAWSTTCREVAALSPDPDSPDNGTIEVQSLDPGTDHARHVVYLPGTDDLGTLPWTRTTTSATCGSDLRSAAGEPTAYQRGILDAMRQAGIGPHEPVLLVGHSLGGMEAAALASRDTGSRSPTWSRRGRRPRRSTASPTACTCCRSSTAATSCPCSTAPTTRTRSSRRRSPSRAVTTDGGRRHTATGTTSPAPPRSTPRPTRRLIAGGTGPARPGLPGARIPRHQPGLPGRCVARGCRARTPRAG